MKSKVKENIVVFSIFMFSFIYRILLIFSHGYPPGPDLGLHNSIINSILLNEGDFSWNQYHMGGGLSLTNPGFHIFTSVIILQTNLPDYAAQAFVAALFSSLMVLCAYLIARKAWALSSAPLIAAFLMAISRYDLEMLLWGGYPNVITLAIIPTIFYLIIKEEVLPTKTFLVLVSILTGTLIFTHSLSSVVYLCMIISFLALNLLFSRVMHGEINFFIKVSSAILLGFTIALPFMVKAFPVYLGNFGVFSGSISENKEATMLTRTVPLLIVLASLIPAVSIITLSKKYSGVLFRRVTLLFCIWILLPAFSTQSFIVGLYTDYFRLLHFLVMPVIIFLALLIDHGLGYLSRLVQKVTATKRVKITSVTFYGASLALTLTMLSFSVAPIFAGPTGGFSIADYYRVVSAPEFRSIQWIREKTPTDPIFISEHGYGWWISGFGQRITLSGTDPQFLIIPHEFEAAYVARTLLDTNFLINNGLIEVREDGYAGRYNPVLLVKSRNTLYPFPIMYLNDSEAVIFCIKDTQPIIVEASKLPLSSVYIEETTAESVCLTLVRKNNDLSFTRKIDVYKGKNFCRVSLTVKNTNEDTRIEYVRLIMHANGKILKSKQTFGVLNQDFGIYGQIIFVNYSPYINTFTYGYPQCLELFYDAKDPGGMNFQLILEAFTVETGYEEYLSKMGNVTALWMMQESKEAPPVKMFDYREILREKDISFIAFKRDHYDVKKFLNNPAFSLVFINDKTVIFKVRTCFVNGGSDDCD